MSGIVAIFHKDQSPIDEKLLTGLTSFMKFCGPDACETWHGGFIAFGHCLLKTTFESHYEKQPLTFDNEVIIVADARIDGRDELVRKLVNCGREVQKNRPDVELILHSYHVWRENCLEHLLGDFSFVIWDSRDHKLFCAHDHFGVEPLYYADLENVVIVSNTLDCIRQHPLVSRKLNPQAIGDFLLFSMNMNLKTTTFSDIHRLPPTHCFTYKNNKLHLRKYWSLPECENHKVHFRRKEYCEPFYHLFYQAVQDRLRTDRAGTYLSGGMDSAAIAAVACDILWQRQRDFDFRSFTVVYRDVQQEKEGKYTQSLAKYLGIPNQLFAAEDYRTTPEVHLDGVYCEPRAIKERVAQLDILQHMAKYARIGFAGYGGDPLFWISDKNVPSLTGKAYLFATWHRFYTWACWPQYTYSRIRSKFFRKKFMRPEYVDLFSDVFLQHFQPQQRLQEIQNRNRSRLRGRQGMFTAPMWSTIFNHSSPGSHKIPFKLVFPFFDLRLVEYVENIIPFPWCKNKHLLREAMKHRLPPQIYLRRKTTLPTKQMRQWQRQQHKHSYTWMQNLLSDDALQEYIDQEKVKKLFNSSQVDPQRLLAYVNFAYWFKVYQQT